MCLTERERAVAVEVGALADPAAMADVLYGHWTGETIEPWGDAWRDLARVVLTYLGRDPAVPEPGPILRAIAARGWCGGVTTADEERMTDLIGGEPTATTCALAYVYRVGAGAIYRSGPDPGTAVLRAYVAALDAAGENDE